jgi:hypothetical protein
VAELLRQLGHEVWIVDPYDGSGNGPTSYTQYRKRYASLKFVRALFTDQLSGLREHYFDCIYSISVLEHVAFEALPGVFAGLRVFLKPEGLTIHAIDHVHRGNGADEHLAKLRAMACGFGFDQRELDSLLAAMDEDTDTYYLSAESHNRWRGSTPYSRFPMRVCVSVQVVQESGQLNSLSPK